MAVYSKEQEDFLREYVSGHTNIEIRDEFNKRFGTDRNINQLSKKFSRMGLKNGNDTKFKDGHKLSKGCEKTQFKSGHEPFNTCPVGTETEHIHKASGLKYIMVKVEQPNVWKQKQVHIYEQLHGAVTKGNVVIFLDNDRTNFNIENLECITRKEHVIMNKRGLRYSDAEVTKVGLNLARVYKKIYDSTNGEVVIPLKADV